MRRLSRSLNPARVWSSPRRVMHVMRVLDAASCWWEIDVVRQLGRASWVREDANA